MLHSWTSILVKFHIERSSTTVHMAWHPASTNPGRKMLLIKYQQQPSYIKLYIPTQIDTSFEEGFPISKYGINMETDQII